VDQGNSLLYLPLDKMVGRQSESTGTTDRRIKLESGRSSSGGNSTNSSAGREDQRSRSR
ncbi:MAG TPA: protease modulator HflK, partial [Gammaproteobacteria bacterium]|nr:protease modulator HflK [Gammaproteobacteria bacterium]